MGFLEIFTKSFSTVYLYYTQLSNLMQENFFPPITFEVYHYYKNCTQNTYFVSNSIHIFNTYVVFIPWTLPISTIGKVTGKPVNFRCQCFTSGFIHFYPEYHFCYVKDTGVCQCPTSGFTHFYRVWHQGQKGLWRCQCPTSGFTHFYKAAKKVVANKNGLCQCPTSGFTHFYTYKKKIYCGFIYYVSMPYIGLYSFLLSTCACTGSNFRRCQCPTSGFTHFYIRNFKVKQVGKTGVNALHRALLISTSLEWTVHGQQPCVNALHRALLISTKSHKLQQLKQGGCQCPTSGFTHFYAKAANTFPGPVLCQCPTSGFTHFYCCEAIANR